MAAMLAAALLAGSPLASRATVERPESVQREVKIHINGVIYEGTSAMIGCQPYVNVESFGHALGLPRVHNVKLFYLGKDGAPKGSPFQVAVETSKRALPTVRFGGATFVDLQAACKALDIPYHWDFTSRTFEVGDPWMNEWMIGAWYRWISNSGDYYNFGEYNYHTFGTQTNPAWPHDRRVFPYERYKPYPDNIENPRAPEPEQK